MRIIKPIEIIDIFRYIEGFNPALKQICELLEKNRLDLT